VVNCKNKLIHMINRHFSLRGSGQFGSTSTFDMVINARIFSYSLLMSEKSLIKSYSTNSSITENISLLSFKLKPESEFLHHPPNVSCKPFPLLSLLKSGVCG
jgi:hypothetical protein